jgi:hypothetical protein
MADDTRGADAEVVHENPDAICVRGGRECGKSGSVALAESKEVYDHDPVTFGYFSHDGVPEMRRGRESMQENDRLSRAARARGVVVELRDTEIHKLAAHRGKMDAGRGGDKHAKHAVEFARPAQMGAKNSEFALAFRDENDILSRRRIVTCRRRNRSYCLTMT